MARGTREDWLADARKLLGSLETISPNELARKLGLPWNTAASLLETLESEGVVSVADRKTGRRHVRQASGELKQPHHPARQRRTWEEVLLGWLQRRQRKD